MKVRSLLFINMQHLRSGLAQDKYDDCAKLAYCTLILTSINGKLTKYTGRHTCSNTLWEPRGTLTGYSDNRDMFLPGF